MIACPPKETLHDLLRGELPADRARALRDHLEGCGSCLDVLDDLSDDADLDLWLAGDVDVARRTALDGLRSARAADPDPLLGPLAGLGALGSYDVEAEIGRGGMGVVYRARDRSMGRVVALKVLRPDAAGDRARRRFLREVQAAARVEHDHIVRVYATADPADPILYFAMEYLAGPSLAQRLRAQGRLDPREAAEVVAQAASGLAAAHAAGLVHRDVKPDNILLDPATGRAKIGDFGLARLTAEVSDLTRDGIVAGTPAYLSPEQARGEADAGPLVDVYALGVTLYECLAAEAPFRGSPHRVVQQILNDEPQPPRARNDSVPRDLETVCLKAMAKEPARRYASADELAADLRRWLAGEPIRARPVGPAGRFRRLCRRRPLAAALAAALAILLVGSSIALAALWRTAESNAARARAHLGEAERSYRQAREAVDKLYVKLYLGQVLNKPGLEAVRTEIIRDILGYYRDFLRRRGDDPALRADAAEAYLRVGLLTTDFGDKRDALSALEHARPLLEALARDNPSDFENRRKLGKCHDQIGTMLEQLGRSPEAFAAHRRACDVYRDLADASPQDARWRRLVGHAFGNLANAYALSGDKAAAIRAYGQAREQHDALLRLDPSHAGYRSDLAMTLNNMAMVTEPADAIRFTEQAMDLRAALAAAGPPADSYARRNLARTRTSLAIQYRAAGRHAEALRLIDLASTALRQVVRGNEGVLAYRRELAESEMVRADIFNELGQSENALAVAKKALEMMAELVRADPENAVFRLYFADAHRVIGVTHAKLGQRDLALRARRARRALLERLTHDYPQHAGYRANLADESQAVDALAAEIGQRVRD